MKQLLVPAFLILALSGVVVRDGSLQSRIDELEQGPLANRRAMVQLEGQLEDLADALAATRAVVHSERDLGSREVEDLDGRLRCLENRLGETGAEVASYNARLDDWETQWSGHEPNQIDQRLQELRGTLEQRWVELDELAASAARLAEEDRQRIEQIDRSLDSLTDRDLREMWQGLVGPVVQIAGDSTVGSGVLLESTPRPEQDTWQTRLLTSWHVVRDIYESPDRLDVPIGIKVYREDGSILLEHALLLAYDVELDVALLELDTEERLENGARLPSRERLAEIQVFDPIYAVGCPLGNDPIPTAGEIASTHHQVDGARYWMISAPTYIGNSGGGIFDAETHELLGIFSKIYTHGSLRSTIVPHMGLVTPLPTIYDWFESVGYLDLAHVAPVEETEPAEAALSTAAR